MKFVMNGAILLGTHDGANIEIAQVIGKQNAVLFGTQSHDVAQSRDN